VQEVFTNAVTVAFHSV